MVGTKYSDKNLGIGKPPKRSPSFFDVINFMDGIVV